MYSGMSAACSCMRCFCRALQATCYCDCSLCGLQLQHIAAGTESCNGDWQKPILRFSFCNGLHIPFVKHLCNVPENVPPYTPSDAECLVCVHVTGSNSILSGSHAAHLESTKDHGKS